MLESVQAGDKMAERRIEQSEAISDYLFISIATPAAELRAQRPFPVIVDDSYYCTVLCYHYKLIRCKAHIGLELYLLTKKNYPYFAL